MSAREAAGRVEGEGKGKGKGRSRSRSRSRGRGRSGSITSVTGLSTKGHKGVLVQLAGLVVRGLEDGSTTHGGLGGGDDGKVLAGDSKQYLPATRVSTVSTSSSMQVLTF